MSKNLYFLVIFLLVALVFFFFYTKEDEMLALRGLLEKGEYKQLHHILDDYQTKFENGKGSEIDIDTAIAIIGNPDPVYKEYFDAWIAAMPDAYTAYLARASYYHSIAWAQRGEGFASETTNEQFAGMHEAQTYALKDINKALELKPRLTVAYSILIAIYSTGGTRQQKFNTLGKALDTNPASYVVRRDMLYFLLPRWGGSYQAIAEFLRDTEQYVDQNPDLAPLMGYLEYAKSWETYSNGDHDKTIEYATAAIEKGEKSWYYQRRADSYYSLKDFESAIRDYSKAIKVNKYQPVLYIWRARAYIRLDQTEKAFKDFEFAVKLFPYDYSVRKHYARALALNNRHEEAIDSYKVALYYHPHDEDILFSMSKIYTRLKQYKEALLFIQKATEINAEEPRYLYEYIIVLNALHDCKVIDVIKNYLLLCEAREGCFEAGVKWVKKTYEILKKSHCNP